MLFLVFVEYPCLEKMKSILLFIIVDVLFCYVSMPYGLKNALPTIVRTMHKTFGDLIRD
jgi:hypothetical protein